MTFKTQTDQGLQGLQQNNFSCYFSRKIVKYKGL